MGSGVLAQVGVHSQIEFKNAVVVESKAKLYLTFCVFCQIISLTSKSFQSGKLFGSNALSARVKGQKVLLGRTCFPLWL